MAQYGSHALGLPPLWLTAYLRAAVVSRRDLLLPRFLREKLAWCDTVVADFPWVHPVFASASARGRLRVLSTHNVEHSLLGDRSRWQDRWTRATVRRIELTAAEACDILVSCCQEDQDFFQENARVARSIVVPNGIDVRRFRGIEAHRTPTRLALGIPNEVKVFLFTASRSGANREAFNYLLRFARSAGDLLREQGIHILVVGNVVGEPLRLPGLTATGKVDVVEPYFAAADAALNPISSGAGTNVKMCEFMAMRLPLVTTAFGGRGFRVEDGRTAFVFQRDEIASVLSKVRRLFDADPARLREIAEHAYAQNEGTIDMDVCARTLAEVLDQAPFETVRPSPETRGT